ncbi:hypothetical protein WMY93_011561 [Mugilogobius chulae]|uniref:chitinase n=1 Tax=Mugilogobius chulae TaxID=88201 RepID=A0AAW0P318_9GOBI
MGVAAFGVAFTLADPNDTGVVALTDGAAEDGCYTEKQGFWSYYETCLYIRGGALNQIPEQSVHYAVTEGQWVGFDDRYSVDAKISHITQNGYGGVCVWALDLDDFTGKFCEAGPNPFISYLKSKLPGPSGSTGSSTGDVCNGQPGVHPNPKDNTTYYNCDHGKATLMPCSPGLVFKTSCSCCGYPTSN